MARDGIERLLAVYAHSCSWTRGIQTSLRLFQTLVMRGIQLFSLNFFNKRQFIPSPYSSSKVFMLTISIGFLTVSLKPGSFSGLAFLQIGNCSGLVKSSQLPDLGLLAQVLKMSSLFLAAV